jgi:hypothetical protein
MPGPVEVQPRLGVELAPGEEAVRQGAARLGRFDPSGMDCVPEVRPAEGIVGVLLDNASRGVRDGHRASEPVAEEMVRRAVPEHRDDGVVPFPVGVLRGRGGQERAGTVAEGGRFGYYPVPGVEVAGLFRSPGTEDGFRDAAAEGTVGVGGDGTDGESLRHEESIRNQNGKKYKQASVSS